MPHPQPRRRLAGCVRDDSGRDVMLWLDSRDGDATPSLAQSHLSRRDAAVLDPPVPVEGALHLDEPDDRADENQNSERRPQPRPAADAAVAPAVAFVHLPDLRREHEWRHEADDERDHEPDDAADALAAVLL